MMADDEEEEFDAYTVLERAVSVCDAEGLGIGGGFRALAEMRRQREEFALYLDVVAAVAGMYPEYTPDGMIATTCVFECKGDPFTNKTGDLVQLQVHWHASDCPAVKAVRMVNKVKSPSEEMRNHMNGKPSVFDGGRDE